MFFDLWAAKEAYGKYTGDGIAESLELDFSSGVSTEDDWQRISISEAPEKEVMLQMVHKIPGYSLAICKGV